MFYLKLLNQIKPKQKKMSNEEARKKNVHADFVSFWILGPIPQDSICLYEIYYMKEEKKTDSQTTSVGIFIDSFKLALLMQIVGMLQNNSKKNSNKLAVCSVFSPRIQFIRHFVTSTQQEFYFPLCVAQSWLA